MLTLEHLAACAEKHWDALSCRVREISIAGRPFDFNAEPAIMGVINLSADSWYRESVCLNQDAAVRRARVLHAQGAQIVDIGAESTLSHAARVDAAGQLGKLLPIIRALHAEQIPASVESYDPKVVRACLEAGANVVNLTGLEHAEEVFQVIASHRAALILCYVQGVNVREASDFDLRSDPIGLMEDYFARHIDQAVRCGVEHIILDPGLGFYYRNLQDSAGRVRHQMTTFLNTFRLRKLGFPVCHALPHAFEFFGEEVRAAEPFFAVLAALGKTDLYRTHEVPRIKAVLETLRSFALPRAAE